MSMAYRIFPQLGLEGRGRREITVIVPEAWDTEKHDGGIASVGDASAVGTQVGEEDRVVFGDLVDLHLTFEDEDEVPMARVW
jgi:hypothetical protein